MSSLSLEPLGNNLISPIVDLDDYSKSDAPPNKVDEVGKGIFERKKSGSSTASMSDPDFGLEEDMNMKWETEGKESVKDGIEGGSDAVVPTRKESRSETRRWSGPKTSIDVIQEMIRIRQSVPIIVSQIEDQKQKEAQKQKEGQNNTVVLLQKTLAPRTVELLSFIEGIINSPIFEESFLRSWWNSCCVSDISMYENLISYESVITKFAMDNGSEEIKETLNLLHDRLGEFKEIYYAFNVKNPIPVGIPAWKLRNGNPTILQSQRTQRDLADKTS